MFMRTYVTVSDHPSFTVLFSYYLFVESLISTCVKYIYVDLFSFKLPFLFHWELWLVNFMFDWLALYDCTSHICIFTYLYKSILISCTHVAFWAFKCSGGRKAFNNIHIRVHGFKNNFCFHYFICFLFITVQFVYIQFV